MTADALGRLQARLRHTVSRAQQEVGEGWTRERFARKHVLLEDDLDARISVVLQPRDRKRASPG